MQGAVAVPTKPAVASWYLKCICYRGAKGTVGVRVQLSCVPCLEDSKLRLNVLARTQSCCFLLPLADFERAQKELNNVSKQTYFRRYLWETYVYQYVLGYVGALIS